MHPIALISVIFWLLVLDIIFLISLPKIIWITITVSLAVLLVTFSVLLLTRKTKYGKAFKIVNYSTVGVAVAALTVSIFHYNYLKKHAFVDTTNINVYKYLPFDDDSKIARLDEDSSLKFSNLNNLPKVDGAAALFPLYSAFVNAVYPSSIEPLNYRDGCFFYTNTIESYKRLALGERDIVFGVDPTNRKDELESLANENGIDFSFDDLELVPMGREGLIFFVNSNNSIDNLTSEQLRGNLFC